MLHRCLIAAFVAATTIQPLHAQESQGVDALSKEELTPFCENKMMWGRFDVEPAQCLEVAVPCSKRIAEKGLSMMEANQALHRCVFKELGLNPPEG